MKTFVILAGFFAVVFGGRICKMTTKEILEEGFEALQKCYEEYEIKHSELSEDAFKNEICSSFCFLRSTKIIEPTGGLRLDVLKVLYQQPFPETEILSLASGCEEKFDKESKRDKRYPCEYTSCLYEEGFFNYLDNATDIDSYADKFFYKEC